MTCALIGHTGFVGSVLMRQRSFDAGYRSITIGEIDGRAFDQVVCCAAPAQKWWANREPEADRRGIQDLMAHLETIHCGSFILISTVDVFKTPVGVSESTQVEEADLHPYGRHRRELEKFIEARFRRRMIVRLPGLVGPGLRKNVIFDLRNGNNLQAIDSRGVFQFYPMVNLWADIQTALRAGLELVHLTAEPVSVADVAREGFGREFSQILPAPPAVYDFKTEFSPLFEGHGCYQYSRRETLLAIRAYAQSEPSAHMLGTDAGQ